MRNLRLALQFCGCTKTDPGGSSSPGQTVVPKNIFGVNMPWENLSDACLTGGELLRDRSFRINSTGMSDLFGNPAAAVWKDYPNGGTVLYSPSGGDSPPGERSYPGYAVLTRSAGDGSGGYGFTGVNQLLADKVSAGDQFTVSFSTYGDGGSWQIMSYLFATTPGFLVLTNQDIQTTDNSSWKRDTFTLTATSGAAYAYINILLIHPDTDSNPYTARIDEVRLSKLSSVPVIKTSVKTVLGSMGVQSIRWPGGTLIDFFDWKNSTGTLLARGENRAS